MLTLEDELERTREELDSLKRGKDKVAWKPLLAALNRHGISSFEKVLGYEFKKILLSIRAKTETWSEEKLRGARNHLEKEIQRLLAPNNELDAIV